MDCTGSMDPYIDLCKEKISAIKEAINQAYSMNIEFGFLGFKDYEDSKHIQYLPFTEDI